MRVGRIFLVLMAASSSIFGASTRVFVKSTGMDVGTCPLTSPCRSFSFAMTQVAPSGEVIALDTAGYGTFTISQPVSVFAPNGVTAFIAVTAGTGIAITAGAADTIVLRGLALSGSGGSIGIDFQGGVALSVENCIINGLGNWGIRMVRSSDASNPRIRIEHSTIRNNGEAVFTANTGMAPPTGGQPPGIAGLTIANSSLSENGTGLDAGDNTRGTVTDTVISGNGDGIFAGTDVDFSFPDVNVERCVITQNHFRGVVAGGSIPTQINHGVVRIAYDMITGNNIGVQENIGGGKIMTMTSSGTATNTIEGNVTNGTFTGSYTAK